VLEIRSRESPTLDLLDRKPDEKMGSPVIQTLKAFHSANYLKKDEIIKYLYLDQSV